MSKGPRYRVKSRRRREGVTDYRKRLNLLKSKKIRMTVRKSLKNTQVQFIEYKENGDNVLATATSKELPGKYNWEFSTSSTPAAYITGFIAGKRAKDKGIDECVFDIGRNVPSDGGRLFAALKGADDAGVKCGYDKKKIPSEDRLMGKHINEKISGAVDDIKKKVTGGK